MQIRIVTILFVVLISNLSGTSRGDSGNDRRLATYSVAIDGISLVVRFSSRNDLGTPINLVVVLENQSDRDVIYHKGVFPVDIEARDSDGHITEIAAPTPDAEEIVLKSHTKIQKEIKLTPKINAAGHYFLTITRRLNEGDPKDWEILKIQDASLYLGPATNPYLTEN